MPLRVCLVSAMFYPARKIKVDFRPEVILASGLRDLGVEVVTCTHWDAFRPHDFDVVHVHHLGIGALRAAFTVSHVPFVYTNHDLRAKYRLLSPTRRLAYRTVLSSVDTTVALSTLEADFLCQRYGLKPERVALIPNGIDDTYFSYERRNNGGQTTPFRLLYVGQLIPLKGLELLFSALRSAAFDWTLDLVFHTSDIRPALEKLAVELQINDRIRFVGKLETAHLASAYQSSDVLILPSFTEALPSVVTEAMLCGTPVIATDVGGIREQLGGFGLLIEPRNESSLTNALNRLAAEYGNFQTQGPAMSKHAHERFDVPDMISSHLDLYSRLIVVGHTRRSPLSKWPLGPVGSRLVRLAASRRRRRCQA
jgi:glycosyltransferase involved in cell wall biosynthesis